MVSSGVFGKREMNSSASMLPLYELPSYNQPASIGPALLLPNLGKAKIFCDHLKTVVTAASTDTGP
jgi:hypothetical protein